MKLTVATCQFPVSADVSANLAHMLEQMDSAKMQGADVIHFPEAALSGYAGVDMPNFDGYDWQALREATESVMVQARELKLWAIVGSAHPLTAPHKPRNCAYIIDDNGNLIDRYDKMFCAGDSTGTTVDLAHYSSGNHFAVFEIKGVRCGVLICHDYRYPELYREYFRRGVRLMFHGYHAGGLSESRYEMMKRSVGDSPQHTHLMAGDTFPGITMPAGMIASASNNFMWISCPNSSAKISCWPSFFVRPDGVITGNVTLHKTKNLLSIVDTDVDYYDSTIAWRERAMNGIFHSGELVEDERSQSRTTV